MGTWPLLVATQWAILNFYGPSCYFYGPFYNVVCLCFLSLLGAPAGVGAEPWSPSASCSEIGAD